MDLTTGTCSLCRHNKVLTETNASEFTALIPDIFLENKKTQLSKVNIQYCFKNINWFSTVSQFVKYKQNVQLCAACAYKLEISKDFKEQYQETNKQKSRTKTEECFVCVSGNFKLVRTDLDPEQLNKKMKAFGETSYSPRKQTAICLHCLFNLGMWCDMQELVLNMVSIRWCKCSNNNNNACFKKSFNLTRY